VPAQPRGCPVRAARIGRAIGCAGPLDEDGKLRRGRDINLGPQAIEREALGEGLGLVGAEIRGITVVPFVQDEIPKILPGA
jgi:hypothetical protein